MKEWKEMKLFISFYRIIIIKWEDVDVLSVAIVAIMGGVVIALAGIITDTLTKKQKVNLKAIEKEIELEKLRLETYTMETEKLRLELEQSKVLLLEEKQNSTK